MFQVVQRIRTWLSTEANVYCPAFRPMATGRSMDPARGRRDREVVCDSIPQICTTVPLFPSLSCRKHKKS
ncbi:hypothetical protein BHE74_00028695 [Ensete ventricosum]|nr:hypothetical protein BHE74_00028695 [Ensete ventricosum]RZS11961.1 hypothetical protein BHM03_00043339 [Ensete ventricosum]